MKTGNKPNIMLGRKTGKEKSSLDNFKAAKHYIVTGRDKSKSKAFETMENYRQSTAKALGILEYTEHNKNWFLYPDNPMSQEGKWQPDKDANHRDMVWEWMIKQGVKIFIEHWSSKGWNIDLRGEVGSMIISAKDTSLFTATEKAWEEYNKQQ